MPKIELHGWAKVVFVAGTAMLLASFIWKLAHQTVDRSDDYSVVICAILFVTGGAANSRLYNRGCSLLTRSIVAIVAAAWGFGILNVPALYMIAPIFLGVLYLAVEETIVWWRARKMGRPDSPSPAETR